MYMAFDFRPLNVTVAEHTSFVNVTSFYSLIQWHNILMFFAASVVLIDGRIENYILEEAILLSCVI